MKKLKNGANLVKNNFPKLQMALRALERREVLVGIPAETNTVRGEEMNNATIGYIMENGAPEMNIPARPHLIPGVEAVKDNVVTQFRMIAKRQLKGDKEAAEQGLNRVGLIAQNSVRKMINSGISPALAPSTLAARRRRGRTGIKPLVDTAQYRNAVTYVLRSK